MNEPQNPQKKKIPTTSDDFMVGYFNFHFFFILGLYDIDFMIVYFNLYFLFCFRTI